MVLSFSKWHVHDCELICKVTNECTKFSNLLTNLRQDGLYWAIGFYYGTILYCDCNILYRKAGDIHIDQVIDTIMYSQRLVDLYFSHCASADVSLYLFPPSIPTGTDYTIFAFDSWFLLCFYTHQDSWVKHYKLTKTHTQTHLYVYQFMVFCVYMYVSGNLNSWILSVWIYGHFNAYGEIAPQ